MAWDLAERCGSLAPEEPHAFREPREATRDLDSHLLYPYHDKGSPAWCLLGTSRHGDWRCGQALFQKGLACMLCVCSSRLWERRTQDVPRDHPRTNRPDGRTPSSLEKTSE